MTTGARAGAARHPAPLAPSEGVDPGADDDTEGMSHVAPQRVLVVVSMAAIHPPRRGNQIRTASLLAQLGAHWRVESYSLTIQRTDLPLPRRRHRVTDRWVDHRIRDPLMLAWATALGRVGYPPVYAERLLRVWPRTDLRRALARADAVLVSPPYQLPWVRRHTPREVPVVLDEHSIEADLYPARRSRWSRVVAKEVARVEREAFVAADHVFVTCEPEASTVSIAGARGVTVVPNGVDLNRFAPVAPDDRTALRAALGFGGDERVAVFVGSGHPPNVEAVEVLERDAEAYRRAGVRIVVVGRCGLGRPRVPNVLTVGEVADVAAYLRAADVALCPLVSGSGTSLKTIEYLAAGLPLVSTPVGVRFLHVRPGVDAEVVAVDDMPARVAALVSDRDHAAALAANGRRVAERYGWAAIGATATDALDRLLAGRNRRRP